MLRSLGDVRSLPAVSRPRQHALDSHKVLGGALASSDMTPWCNQRFLCLDLYPLQILGSHTCAGHVHKLLLPSKQTNPSAMLVFPKLLCVWAVLHASECIGHVSKPGTRASSCRFFCGCPPKNGLPQEGFPLFFQGH